jgi:integrase/recombinase XerC
MAVNELLIIGHPELMAERQRWLSGLGEERRLSGKTVEAYERDTRQFLHFLTGHLSGPARLSDISALRPGDLRGFLASRRRDGAGARTLGRGLAGLRSFLRYLEKKGLANAAGASAVRSPKQPKSLPKPLTSVDALMVVTSDAQLAEEPWIATRNAAVLTLLYGCGLRISEALDP